MAVTWRPSKGRDHAIARERDYVPPALPDIRPWPQILKILKNTVEAYGPVKDWPQPAIPCQMVLTGAAGRGNTLRVRCLCMAQTVSANPSPRFYNYDWIGEAADIPSALRLWHDKGHGSK
jgi:hypothetical protein